MSYQKYIHILLVPILFGTFLCNAFWKTTDEAKEQYEAYKKESKNYCDSNDRLWKWWNGLVPIIDYPQLDTSSINAAIAKWKANPRVIGDEKSRLDTDLNMERIGEYNGFKVLEASRIAYRSQMNWLFACAVISSRINILDDLQKIISKKVENDNSEILIKLKRESESLKKSKNTLKCNTPDSDSSNKEMTITMLTNTAVRHYCHYSHYLGYLESQVDQDLISIQQINAWIWNWGTENLPSNINEWNSLFQWYKSSIDNEFMRVNTTMPRALASFIEMDKTYAVHLMLTIIYDDYIKFRKQLSIYMNLNSQTYQKANNAQNPNIK